MADKAKRERPTELERLKGKIARIDECLGVCEEARRSVSDLIRLPADGNRLVAYTVFMLAGQLVGGLDSIVKARPKLGRWLARNDFMWPAFYLSQKTTEAGKREAAKHTAVGQRRNL